MGTEDRLGEGVNRRVLEGVLGTLREGCWPCLVGNAGPETGHGWGGVQKQDHCLPGQGPPQLLLAFRLLGSGAGLCHDPATEAGGVQGHQGTPLLSHPCVGPSTCSAAPRIW